MPKLQTKGPIEDLTDAAYEYVDLRIEELKLKATKKGAKILGHSLAAVVIVLVVFLTVAFMLLTAAYFIGDMLSSTFYGFAIVTGVLVIVSAILLLCQKKLFINKSVRMLIDILFGENE